MNTLSGGRRRKRAVSEAQLIALLVAAFTVATVGLVALIAYRLVEQTARVLGA